MRQTDKQLAQHLLAHRSRGYSIRYVIRVSRRQYGVNLIAIAVLAVVGAYSQDPLSRGLCLLLIGMPIGAFLRDVGWLRRLKMNWPFTERVVDWKKVEEIAEQDEPRASDALMADWNVSDKVQPPRPQTE